MILLIKKKNIEEYKTFFNVNYVAKKPEQSEVIKKLQLKRNLKLRLKKNFEEEKSKINNAGNMSIDHRGVYNESNNIKSNSNDIVNKDKNKRKRKRKHKRYIRNSTIITINKICKENEVKAEAESS